MAFYLHRAFSQDPEVHVLNNLRIEDPEQPEQDGTPAVCQIDHLLVHPWGVFIVESKSVSEKLRVRPDGSDGDEWSRVYRGDENGIPSPIRQAERQGEFLRTFLERHREQLRGRLPVGLRTAGKVIKGTDQRGFAYMPIQIMIAISDNGRIDRLNGWKEPTEPFQTFVAKADQIPSKVKRELKRHRDALSLLNKYGLWRLDEEELNLVTAFLAAQHVERMGQIPSAGKVVDISQGSGSRVRTPKGTRAKSSPKCRFCGSEDISAQSGRYGYYWRCAACGKNTAMPEVCSHCGNKGYRGRGVSVRKRGSSYVRDCQNCGKTETIWREV